MSFYVWSLLDHERHSLLVKFFELTKDYEFNNSEIKELVEKISKINDQMKRE